MFTHWSVLWLQEIELNFSSPQILEDFLPLVLPQEKQTMIRERLGSIFSLRHDVIDCRNNAIGNSKHP